MILFLEAIGAFGNRIPGPGDYTAVTPAARTVVLRDSGRGTPVRAWTESLDPYDVLDYKMDASGLLETGENIKSYTVLPTVEAELKGLRIGRTDYETVLSDNAVTFWVSVDATKQQDNIFTPGVALPIELSFTTDSLPPRKKQRTVLLTVVQR